MAKDRRDVRAASEDSDGLSLVQSSSSLAVRRHRLNFYVVLRKLIPKLQTFSQGIQETPMVRFYSSIYSDDKVLIRQMSRDSVFHGLPTRIRCRSSNEDRMPRQRSQRFSLS
jgi:hypothetical protein